VFVQIFSIKPNTDLEGDDDFVPFYDNHADIYGFVTIDGETFKLPQIPENDFPHWEATGPRKGIFEKAVTSSPVPIRIDIWEGDSGITFDDDHVDINPMPGKHHLDFDFDLCSLTLSGDLNRPSQGLHQISGGSGGDAATITFRIGLKDGRPVSQSDLALIDLDLIQVVPRTPRLVARKGTVVLVRIANNHTVAVNTNLRIRVNGGGLSVDQTFPLQLAAGEVKKQYLFAGAPIMFPAAPASYPVSVIADITDPGSSGLPSDDCRLRNDSFVNRLTWKVVTTDPNFSLLWAKVGTLLDVGNYAPDSHFDEIVELGTGYIRAVYPLLGPNSSKSPIDIPPPPVTAASDWLVTVLSAFGLPADAVEPVVLTFELNGLAALLPQSRLMGVLPNKDWFARFSFWSEVTGFSLGEFAPHAVIFLPRLESGSQTGPQTTLPAHELGHTFGLSTDSRLKTSWVCDFDWPVVGHAPCGLAGGFDEYKHNDPNLQDGNPASGYWVRRGSEPPALAPLADTEQCDSHCFMGNSPVNAHTNWMSDGRWIDPADYDQLIDKLVMHPDPEVVYVSGMISWHNQLYLGRCVRLEAGVSNHSGRRGMYGFRFLDEGGADGERGRPAGRLEPRGVPEGAAGDVLRREAGAAAVRRAARDLESRHGNLPRLHPPRSQRPEGAARSASNTRHVGRAPLARARPRAIEADLRRPRQPGRHRLVAGGLRAEEARVHAEHGVTGAREVHGRSAGAEFDPNGAVESRHVPRGAASEQRLKLPLHSLPRRLQPEDVETLVVRQNFVRPANG
jgi:hypothetical protein